MHPEQRFASTNPTNTILCMFHVAISHVLWTTTCKVPIHVRVHVTALSSLATECHLSLYRDSAAVVTLDVMEVRYGINTIGYIAATSSYRGSYRWVNPNVSDKFAIP
jgi:hypothetical protein